MTFLALAYSNASWGVAAWLLGATFILYPAAIAIHRLWFHPLARIPGPKLYAVTNFPSAFKHSIQGIWITSLLGLHEKYGPVVRVGPDRLSMVGSVAWPEVYAHRPEHPEFGKARSAVSKRENASGIFTAAGKEEHRRQRRLLSHAFSDTALQEQEHYVVHYLDLLIRRLREQVEAGKPVDVTRWYNYLTFDVIGDLSWGDPFNSLDSSDYHPWVASIFSGLRGRTLLVFLASYPFLTPLVLVVFGKKYFEKQKQFNQLTREKAEKRIALGADARKDFMTHVLKHNTDGKGMTHDEMVQNSNTLIIGGSETSATAMSGLTFLLGQNLDVCRRLVEEVRASFASEEDITMRSTVHLQYLRACLDETLRLYPPAPGTSPRESPGAYVNGWYIPKGTRITASIWATNRSPRNFVDADKFVPERWLPTTHPLYDTRYDGDNKAVFKPFSHGPRDCIGKNLAYAEMRMTMARVLWNFDIELLPGQDDWIEAQRCYFLWDKPALIVRMKPGAKG